MKRYLLIAIAIALAFAASAEAQTDPDKKAPAKSPSPELTALADHLPLYQRRRLMEMVNRGNAKALVTLPGIGEARAAAIIAGRPYSTPLDLLRISGIGEVILSNIIKHAHAGFPVPPRK